MSFAEHAEAWWSEQGNTVPARQTSAWTNMYQKWIDFAFAGFGRG